MLSKRKILRIIHIETFEIRHESQPLVAVLHRFVATVFGCVIFVLQTL